MGDVLSTHLDDARRQNIAGEDRSAPRRPGAPPGTLSHASDLAGRGRGSPRVKARVAAGTGQTLTLPLNLFLSVWTALPGPSVCSLPPLRSQGPNFSTGTCSPWSPAWPEPYTYSLDRVAKGSRPHPSQQRPKPNLYSGLCPTQSDLPDSPLSCLVPSRPGFSSGTRG